jgi:hypothetical protein
MTNRDGSVWYREEQIKYTAKNEKRIISSEMREEIKKLHEMGVKNKVICNKFNLTPYLLNQILAYQPTADELKEFAKTDAAKATEVPVALETLK